MTATRTTLLALAERVEAATGADRELDEDIGIAIGRGRTVRVGHECLGNVRDVPINCPRYTASLDAAMSLVPSGCSEWNVESWSAPGAIQPAHVRATAWVSGAARVYAATPALALTAACLRACAAVMGGAAGSIK